MIYFDSAATTFQKPPGVRKAVERAMQTMSSPGRGGYSQARAAEEMIILEFLSMKAALHLSA